MLRIGSTCNRTEMYMLASSIAIPRRERLKSSHYEPFSREVLLANSITSLVLVSCPSVLRRRTRLQETINVSFSVTITSFIFLENCNMGSTTMSCLRLRLSSPCHMCQEISRECFLQTSLHFNLIHFNRVHLTIVLLWSRWKTTILSSP